MDSTSSQRKIPRPKYLRNGREQVTALSALALLVVAQPKRCSLDTLLHIKRKHFLCVEGPVLFRGSKGKSSKAIQWDMRHSRDDEPSGCCSCSFLFEIIISSIEDVWETAGATSLN